MSILNLRHLIIAVACFASSAMLFANDVQVLKIREDVIVVGDNSSNDVRISRVYGSLHSFQGRNGTTINGSTETVILPIGDDLVVRMQDGDDVLDIRSARIRGMSHADLKIDLGDGHDKLTIDNASVRRDLLIDADEWGDFGDDEVRVEDTTVGNDLDVRLAHGDDDQCRVMYCEVGGWIDLTAQGSSLMLAQGNDAAILWIHGGPDADTITAVSNDVVSTTIFGSDQGDTVTCVGNHALYGSSVFLLDGDDDIHYQHNSTGRFGMWPSVSEVDGGAGRDRGIVQAGFWEELEVRGF